MDNPFLDPGWLRTALAYWSARLVAHPEDRQAWSTLTTLEELAWKAGVEIPALPDLRPAARAVAAGMVALDDLEARGLEVVWRDRLEGLRRELPALRQAVATMTRELSALRAELAAGREEPR